LSNIPIAEEEPVLTTALIAGVSYIITVRLRVPIFARSNIYWDDGTSYNPQRPPKLTFIPAADDPADNFDNHQGYQGVFFKWGSLVGISPALTSGSYDFSGSTDIYVPVVNNTLPNSTWKATTGDAMENDNTFPTVTSNWTSWSYYAYVSTEIPYMDQDRGSGTPGWGNTWLIDAERNVLDTIQGFRGDICQYLGKTQTALDGYRLPTFYEFGTNTESWVLDGTFNVAYALTSNLSADGTTIIINGSTPYDRGYVKNTSMDDVVFPASGCRGRDGGLAYMGNVGFYVSGSVSSTLSINHMYANGGGVMRDYFSRAYATPIRCVKKVDPTGSY
jgi:hypothetical protein